MCKTEEQSILDQMPDEVMQRIQREALETIRFFTARNSLNMAVPETGANLEVRVPVLMLLLGEVVGEALLHTVYETDAEDNEPAEIADAIAAFVTDSLTEILHSRTEFIDKLRSEKSIFTRLDEGEVGDATLMEKAGLVRKPEDTVQ